MMSDKSNTALSAQRIDKWLWVARFYKSRTLAANAVKGGKVQCNGERSKPGRTVAVGDCLRIRKGMYEFEVLINKLNRYRLSAAAVQELYTETESSEQERLVRKEQARAERLSMPVSKARPNKRDRRILLATKNRQAE